MAVVVVLPAPCRPAIRITAGGWALQVEVGDAPSPIVAASSRLTTPTSAWPGDERADDLGAEGLILDAGDEVAHHRQRDVGLEQRHAHLAQHVLDVLLGDAGLAAHRLDEPAQAIGEGGSHRWRAARVAGCESTLWR